MEGSQNNTKTEQTWFSPLENFFNDVVVYAEESASSIKQCFDNLMSQDKPSSDKPITDTFRYNELPTDPKQIVIGFLNPKDRKTMLMVSKESCRLALNVIIPKGIPTRISYTLNHFINNYLSVTELNLLTQSRKNILDAVKTFPNLCKLFLKNVTPLAQDMTNMGIFGRLKNLESLTLVKFNLNFDKGQLEKLKSSLIKLKTLNLSLCEYSYKSNVSDLSGVFNSINLRPPTIISLK